MLPNNVWYHNYDQPCELCQEQICVKEDDAWVGSCEAEHKKTCDNRGCAYRQVFNAKITIQEKESELRGVKRKLEELEEEFCHARISLAQARLSDRKLYKL
mmetsp:Transcript_17330/g.20769  ORF Transcript_17330/g.20769 Transcript_17330/m.20769 type:complete len:101 (-) Transcript_17330:132-434(-)